MSRETLLVYPNLNNPFVIHIDISLLQLEPVLSQVNKKIAFYGRKLNPPQVKYTTTERELLFSSETFS